MASDSFWIVRPGKGLGKLEFGMSPAQVDALSDVYGAVTGRGSAAVPDDVLHETLEKFGDAMSEDEKQDFLAMYAQMGPSADSVTETRGDPGLVLGYSADRLVEIMPARGHSPLLLDGKDLLSIGARETLVLLERLNGGPGRYADTEAAFDELAISVEGFSVIDRSVGVRMLEEADERFQGRTMILRPQPFLPEGERDRFITQRIQEH